MRNPVRPTSIDDMMSRLANFRSNEAAEVVNNFPTRPSDVFICTYTKSGTTWTQQIVHQLRTGGSMAFDDISVVVPWLETAVDIDVDPTADQRWEPRAFKSHLSSPEIPPGGRYITVFRDPLTVLPSFYQFFEGWFFEPGTIPIEDFARAFYIGGSASGRHWQHLIEWWPRIGDDDVLALSYEDMVADPDAVPPIVADFLGIELDDETMSAVIGNCRRSTMAQHGSKFEEILLREKRDPIMGLPEGGNASKVNAKTSAVLSLDLATELDAVWAETVTPTLGFASYDEFRAALPDPLGARS
ncbi:MAG: hypothetical protein ACI81L_001638 [Verrucomicrobiales bacterium]|jgi:hypothetical protein